MKIAFKNFLMTLKRYKVASFLNIAGLTLAFAAFYVIASQVIYSLTYNRSLKDSERIFNVAFWSKSSENWSANSPNPISYEVADIMPEVESIASMKLGYSHKNVYSKVNGHDFEKFYWRVIDCNFSIVDVIDFNIVTGNIEDFNVEDAVIISRSAAEKMNVTTGDMIYMENFGNGKPELPLTVAAIFEDFDRNTIFDGYDVFLNDERRDGMTNNNHNYAVFVKLTDEGCVEKFTDLWVEKYNEWGYEIMQEYITQFGDDSNVAMLQEEFEKTKDVSPINMISLNKMYFQENYDPSIIVHKNTLSATFVMIAIALIIVIVAFINFVNFFMALVPVRMKAVNICKVFGAGQGTLRWNFVFEAIGLVFIALLFALYIVFALKDSFISNYVTCSLAFSENIATIIIVVAIAILIAVVAAVYPAFYITKFNASMAVKSGFAYSKSGRNLRSILISTQFIVSMTLIIITAVFFLQYRFMLNYDIGIDKENVLVIFPYDFPAKSGETLIQKLEANPQVKEVTATMSSFVGIPSSINGYTKDDGNYYDVNIWYVRWNLIDFFKIPVLEGEGFTPNSNGRDMLINSCLSDNVDMKIGDKLDGWNTKGIMANVHNMSLQGGHVNTAYLCYNDYYSGYYLRMQDNVDVKEMKEFIKTTVKEIAPFSDVIQIDTFDEHVGFYYYDIKKQVMIVAVFALIAIVISLMGIFGIVLFETQHRRREIGIRKVYGATTENVINMFARRYAVIVVICFVVAAPIAWFISSRWLEQFANRIAMPLWVYALVLIVVLVVTMTIVILRSWKAANENPIDAIN